MFYVILNPEWAKNLSPKGGKPFASPFPSFRASAQGDMVLRWLHTEFPSRIQVNINLRFPWHRPPLLSPERSRVRGQVQRAGSLFFEGCDKEKAQNVTVFSIIVPTEKHSAFELGFLFENKGFFTQ
jgi:hypothetical protein